MKGFASIFAAIAIVLVLVISFYATMSAVQKQFEGYEISMPGWQIDEVSSYEKAAIMSIENALDVCNRVAYVEGIEKGNDYSAAVKACLGEMNRTIYDGFLGMRTGSADTKAWMSGIGVVYGRESEISVSYNITLRSGRASARLHGTIKRKYDTSRLYWLRTACGQAKSGQIALEGEPWAHVFVDNRERVPPINVGPGHKIDITVYGEEGPWNNGKYVPEYTPVGTCTAQT